MKSNQFGLTTELLSGIADAICTEIGSSVLDGVHYISIKDTPAKSIIHLFFSKKLFFIFVFFSLFPIF